MSRRNYGAQPVCGRMQTGMGGRGGRGPQNMYGASHQSSAAPFGWSSSPQDPVPWISGSSSKASMSAGAKRASPAQFATSANFRGQGTNIAQPADRHGHQAKQNMWDAQSRRNAGGGGPNNRVGPIMGIPMVSKNKSSSQQQQRQSQQKQQQSDGQGGDNLMQKGRRNWTVQDMHSFIGRQSGGRDFADAALPAEFQNNLINIGGRFGMPQRATSLPAELAAFARPFVSASAKKDEEAKQQQQQASPTLAPPQQMQQQRRAEMQKQRAMMMQQRTQQQQGSSARQPGPAMLPQQSHQRGQQSSPQMPMAQKPAYIGARNTASLIEQVNTEAVQRDAGFTAEGANEMQMNDVLQQYGRPMEAKRQQQQQKAPKTVVHQPPRAPPQISLKTATMQSQQSAGRQMQFSQFINQEQPAQQQQAQQENQWESRYQQQQQPNYVAPISDDRPALFEREEQRLNQSVQRAAPRLKQAQSDQPGSQQQVPQLKTLSVSRPKQTQPPANTAEKTVEQSAPASSWIPVPEKPAPSSLPTYTPEEHALYVQQQQELIQQQQRHWMQRQRMRQQTMQTAPAVPEQQTTQGQHWVEQPAQPSVMQPNTAQQESPLVQNAMHTVEVPEPADSHENHATDGMQAPHQDNPSSQGVANAPTEQ